MRRTRATLLGLSLAMTGALPAIAAIDQSPRPAPRLDAASVENGAENGAETDLAEVELTASAGAIAPQGAGREAPDKSLKPRARPETGGRAAVRATVSTKNPEFTRWISRFRGRALAQGIRPDTFDGAFGGIGYNSEIIGRDRNQSEFTKTIWDYLDSAASETRIANGRAVLETYGDLLDRIEARYGVDKEVVVAVWGLESAYGAHRGRQPIVEALATLAFDGRRGRFFEAQLVAALKIIQAGDVAAPDMTGSWAGAMGHTQFIPTSYLAYAVDFTGDGKRDIWSDDPADALASTAAYLARFGWETGMPWGVEVQLPRGFDYQLAGRQVKKTAAEWADLGVVTADGGPVPDHGAASILLPAGARGAAFMVFKNFGVIERYNTADAYVIGVGHLSDRLKGKGPIRADWPRGDRALTSDERRELQRRLTASGFDTRGVDGRIGPMTEKAIRGYQRAAGLIPDGHASLDLLNRLR